jgi:hypothetical protein
MAKWQDILRDCRKFISVLQIAKKEPRKSGETRSDIQEHERAMAMFFHQQSKTFEFVGCFNLLKNTTLLTGGLGQQKDWRPNNANRFHPQSSTFHPSTWYIINI